MLLRANVTVCVSSGTLEVLEKNETETAMQFEARRAAMCGFMAGALGLACACLAQGQTAELGQPLIPGYLNPRTGAFRPHIVSLKSLAAGTTYSGEFSVTINITIASTLPSGQPVTCEADVEASDATGTFYAYTVSGTATVTGAKAACTLTIPYSWTLGTSPTYSIGGSVGSTGGTVENLRELSFPVVGSTKFPTTGGTTKFTVAATL
jgi:hypothetical protein